MCVRFVWQAWHLRHWAGSGDSLGRRLSPVTPPLLRGRRGTWRHLLSFCVAGVGDISLRFVWQAWHLRHWAGSGDGLGRRWSTVTPRFFCVAGVALGDICLRFVWQAWHLATSAFVLCGRRGTYGTGLALVTALAWHLRHWAGSGDGLGRRLSPVTPRLFCVAGVALGDICLRLRGTYGTGLPLVTALVAACPL
eukprot:s363_g26.t1